jgi:hypothetical protein
MYSKPIALSTFACVTAAFLIAPGSVAMAQQPKSPESMLCSTSAGGPGFVLVKLSNLTSSSIPKGETLFAKKGDKTIQFNAAEAIPAGGTVTYSTSEGAFQVEGNCDGWH